jgi:hypothetical protein
MALCNAAALPASLAGAAEVLGLRHQKSDPTIMRLMAKPRRARHDEDPDQIYYHDDEPRRQQVYEYCRADVEAERELIGRLPRLIDSEQRVGNSIRKSTIAGFAPMARCSKPHRGPPRVPVETYKTS